MLLNRANDKVEAQNRRQEAGLLTGRERVKSYAELVMDLEDEETERINNPQPKDPRQPLYRKLFPEWGRVHARVLN